MTRHTSKPVLDALVRIDQIPASGRDFEIEADAEQREALTGRLGVSALEAFGARVNVRALRGGVRVRGRLKAAVVQPCVVTFEPVRQSIDEPVDRVFLPGREERYEGPPGAEVYVDLEGEDPPDHYEGNEIDLSELLVETLSLAIDPYPRLEGVDIPPEARDEEDDSPFAKLKALKDNGQ